MASTISAIEEEQELNLKEWILKCLNNETYGDVLKWDDKQKAIFHILWMNKGSYNWEKGFEVFVGWAKHRETLKDPVDYVSLKSNFRNLINKTHDFEKLKPIQNQQTGNRLIYRFRTKAEIKQVKQDQKQKKRSSTESSLSTTNSSVSSTDFQDLLDSIENCMSVAPENVNLQTTSLEEALPGELAALNMQQTICSANNYELPATADEAIQVNEMEHNGNGAVHLGEHDQLPTFEQWVTSLNMNPVQLSCFNITVRYKQTIVKEVTADIRQGIRLSHGNTDEQLAIANEMQLHDILNIPTLQLPPSDDPLIQKSLNELKLGVVFKYQTSQYQCPPMIWLARLTILKVYSVRFNDDLVSIKRSSPFSYEPIFCYVERLNCMQEQVRAGKRLKPMKTICLVGSKNNLISVTLTPSLSENLCEVFCNEASSISMETSLDNMYNQMKHLYSKMQYSYGHN
uniref:IRF tryptophan pentad repeat domain-containing protein n=1 Tax=Ciona intestinalis TaxID=7719 RepID=F6QBB9_CIOIN